MIEKLDDIAVVAQQNKIAYFHRDKLVY